MKNLEKKLSGGYLRSIGKSNAIALAIASQQEFDKLFQFLFHQDRLIRMRASDAVEKVSATYPGYLAAHKNELLQLLKTAATIELQWHAALMISRVQLSSKELAMVWDKLTEWAMDRKQGRIVRVNSLQSLFDLSIRYPAFQKKFAAMIIKLEDEGVPSLSARIRKLRKQKHSKNIF